MKCPSGVWAREWSGAWAVALQGTPLVRTETRRGGRAGSGAGLDQGCGCAECGHAEEVVALRVYAESM